MGFNHIDQQPIKKVLYLEKNLKLLTDKMKSRKWDAFLVPRCDMYAGEEVPENEERLKFISNFSGSAGYAIISAKSKMLYKYYKIL